MRRFVADAVHELRTLLTAVQGYAQRALRRERLVGRRTGRGPPADRTEC
ncbi:histidine kinase dimerization/phospho-acceptor domain-containing protein [Streptomyces sp. NPDC005474]